MTIVAAPLTSASSAVLPSIQQIGSEDQERLKRLRLRALKDSPHCFLSVHSTERQYHKDRWAAEFERGDWYAGVRDHRDISLIGVTREPGTPESECYIEYMWVDKRFRRHGSAQHMLQEVLEILRTSDVKVVYLWVLNGNEAAAELYKKVGFRFTGLGHPLAARPGRSEHQMTLPLC